MRQKLQAGYAYVLRVLDGGASIDLDAAHARLAQQGAGRGPSTLRGPLGAGAGGIHLARSPVDVSLGRLLVGQLETDVRVRLFEFGVVSVRFRVSLAGLNDEELVRLAAHVEDDAGFDDAARSLWERLVPGLDGVVSQPAPASFIEDYSVFVLPSAPSGASSPDETITRILLGEADPRPLAQSQLDDAGARAIRYFADDLVIVDFDAAVVIDPYSSPELVDIFELATAYLVELRHYDRLLSRASASMAEDAAKLRNTLWLLRSPFQALAERAVLLVLELTELTDNFERSIVLQGDTYSVQVYRAAADRFRIAELTASVHAKREGLARSAEVLSDHLHGRRGLALEMLVVLLISIEIAQAFWRHLASPTRTPGFPVTWA